MKKLILILTAIFTCSLTIFAQEALKSIEEEYYDFLSLTGVVERPTLGYRTLSDSIWNFKDIETFEENEDGTFTKVRVPGAESTAHIWKNNNLGTTYTLWQPSNPSENWFTRGLTQGIKLRLYGPEWYNSYNTAAPYGQNDGALWQGKGYNTSLTAGLRLEAYGFEVTFKPQVSFMQNKAFDYIKPNYSGSNYSGNAEIYGYYGVPCVDAPQRFGNASFWTFDFGDSEIRYTFKNFTLGFGTQTPWVGPAKINPIIHSNNAASYTKFDIGLRRTELYLPHFNIYLGDIEFRAWWGKLSESNWFDNDSTNNHNLISGLSFNYQLPFLKELTIGVNRTMLSKWDNISPYTLFNIYIPFLSSGNSGGDDKSDQRISFIIDYNNKTIGFEMYFEWGKNDYSPSFDHYIRYPFHTQGWTFGAIKSFSFNDKIKGEILLELTFLECSADYDRLIKWYSTFYAHHAVTQGYTNEGQWIGAGIGTGGNSQYLGLKLYIPNAQFTIFAQRRNPDLDYTMYIDSKNDQAHSEQNIRAIINIGVNNTFFITKSFSIDSTFVFVNEHNPLNINHNSTTSNYRNNLFFALQLNWNI